MIGFMEMDMQTHLILFALFLGMAIGALALGRYTNLLKFQQLTPSPKISGWSVFLCISLYFALFKVIAPFILILSAALATGEVPYNLQLALGLEQTVVANIAFIWLSLALFAMLVAAYGEKNRIHVWNPGENGLGAKLRAIFLSPVYYLLAFPWILVIGQGYVILGILLFGEPPPVLEQSMVSFLKELLPYPQLFTLTAFTIVFIIPLQEELLFRGLLQRWLTPSIGALGAILLTSAVFSSLHYGAEQGFSNVMLLSVLFVFSLFLGLIYEKFGTLWAPAALHALFNGISVFMLYNS